MSVPRFHPIVTLIGEAIARYEGFYHKARADSNNNPGNLKGWDKNNPKDSSGFDIFKSRSAGFNALYRQIEKNIFERELSLQEFFEGKIGVYGGYAPASDKNEPIKYAQYVARFLEDRGYTDLSIIHGVKYYLAINGRVEWDFGKDKPVNYRRIGELLINDIDHSIYMRETD